MAISYKQAGINSYLREGSHNCYMELHSVRSRCRPRLPRTQASSETSSGTAYEIDLAPRELPRMTRLPELRGSRSSEFVASRQISDPPRIYEELCRFLDCSDREPLIDTPCCKTWVNYLSKERNSSTEAIAGLPFSRYTWIDALCIPSDVSVTSCPSITSIGSLGHVSSYHSLTNESETIGLSNEYEALDIIDLVWSNEEFMKWLNAANTNTTNPILYMTGSAGAGKSAVCSKVVDYLQKHRRAGEIIVHYFADGRFANSNLAIDILRNTMMELIWRSSLAKRNDIKSLLSDLLSARLSLSRSQIRDFLQRIKHSVSSEETLYFVLDGLDDVEESQHAIDFLNEILDLGNTYDRNHPVKVLVSSRPSFLRKESLQGALFLDIDKVTSNWRNRLWTLQERILGQATGITSLTVLHSIKDLPRDLPDVYRYMINRISKQYQDVALQMLRWVTYAARPLCTRELLGAISLQMSVLLAETDILGICRGLLSIAGDGTVNLVHLSLRNYLQSQSDKNDILGWRAVSAATHEMITHTCFQILEKSTGVVDLPDVVKDDRFLAFWDYAAENWRFHYSHAERQSTYLPGMLHERLINIWEVSDGTFGQEHAPNSLSPGEESPKATNTSSIAFLNAALAEGARSGMPRLIRLELEMGADPNAADNFGNTPLHHAAAAGNVEAVRLLIEYGANVNVASNSGNTPLSYAVSNRRLEVVELLLTHPSNPFGKHSGIHGDEKECGSQQYACQNLSLVALLSHSCSDCGVVQSNFFLSKVPLNDGNGELVPPIHAAGQTVPLAECGISVAQGINAFSYGSVVTEHRTIVKWFPGISMYKALSIAARSGMEDVIRLLIAAGNDIKFLNRNISLSRIMSQMQNF